MKLVKARYRIDGSNRLIYPLMLNHLRGNTTYTTCVILKKINFIHAGDPPAIAIINLEKSKLFRAKEGRQAYEAYKLRT